MPTLTTREINVTPEAVTYLMGLKDRLNPNAAGLRLAIKEGKGCSGNEYDLQFVDTAGPADDVLQIGSSLTVFIPQKDVLKLFGLTVDYVTDALGNARIEIRNPNEKSRCGCGESVGF